MIQSESEAQETIIRAIYYAKGKEIFRSNADGSEETLVITDTDDVRQIRVDSAANQIYWSVSETANGGPVKRANLTGANQQVVVPFARDSVFDVDRDSNEIYFLRSTGVERAALIRRNAATAVEGTILVDSNLLSWLLPSISIDSVGRHAYIAIATSPNLYRIGMDTSNQGYSAITTIDVGLWDMGTAPGVDTDRGLIYFGWEDSLPGNENIHRKDTVNSETAVSGIGAYFFDLVRPHNGTDTIFFSTIYSDGIFRADFFDGEAEIVVPGVRVFALDIVDPSSADAEPPEITIVNPLAGVTSLQSVSLAGLVTDNNNLVARATWEVNGVSQGSLNLSSEGSFQTSEFQLIRGANSLRVIAEDIDGNESQSEVVVRWEPLRELSLGGALNVSEGDLLRVPITLKSEGDLGGMSFSINYDEDFLAVREFEEVGAALTENVSGGGRVTASFIKSGSAIPPGEQLIGYVTFRVRSVPANTVTTLDLSILNASDPSGLPLSMGNVAVDSEVSILQRLFVGDVNTNGQLDVGDAFLLWKLLLGFEEARTWDHGLNDLNGSMTLDLGDMVTLLNTILGVVPQPTEPKVVLPAPLVEQDGPRAFMTVDEDHLTLGDLIMVEVHLDQLRNDIGGLSFIVDYPVEALLLESSASHSVGSLVEVSPLWHVFPVGDDYENQTGSISFAATDTKSWMGSKSGGIAATLVFRVQDGFQDQRAWPILLHKVRVSSADGYVVDEPGAVILSLLAEKLTYEEWATTQFNQEELANVAISGRDGDPDRDGVSNLQEYFQGTLALNAGDDVIGWGTYLEVSGQEIPVISTQRDLTTSDVVYQLEMSSNLTDWEEKQSRVYHRALSTDPALEEIFIGPVDDLSPWTGLFMRLTFSDSSGQP